MDYEKFKNVILNLSGIDLNYYKERQMKRRIDSLIRKNTYNNYEEYFYAIKENKKLYSEFINYLTINVSEFYRNPEQWTVLKNDVLPILLRQNSNPIIWSSACSTGDEPYTMVMVLNKFLPLEKINVIATDIDRGALEKAKLGIYSKASVDKLPEEYIRKYFKYENDSIYIKDFVKERVKFRMLNLLKDDYPKGCDLIICRNVLIYFTQDAKSMIYEKFNRSLKEKGILFVGSTEQIINASNYKFKSVRTFFYKKEGNIGE